MADDREPLWSVMHNAYWEAAGCGSPGAVPIPHPSPECNAAELRAMRDWLVPEEEPVSRWLVDAPVGYQQRERQRLRALLTAEAERAESRNPEL